MQNLKPTELAVVVGGTKQNDQITQQLTTLQSSLKDLTSNTSNGSGSNNTFMMLAMMMAMRPQPTVVAAGGPPVVAAAGPVVNISTRLRHG
jgi:hypothetical protein